MAARLSYRATTATGNQLDFDFDLHPQTRDPVQVSNLLTAVIEAVDREIGVLGDVGNGDVLQALTMALAVRARMLSGMRAEGSGRTAQDADIDALVAELVGAALASPVTRAEGNVPPGADRSVH